MIFCELDLVTSFNSSYCDQNYDQLTYSLVHNIPDLKS